MACIQSFHLLSTNQLTICKNNKSSIDSSHSSKLQVKCCDVVFSIFYSFMSVRPWSKRRLIRLNYNGLWSIRRQIFNMVLSLLLLFFWLFSIVTIFLCVQRISIHFLCFDFSLHFYFIHVLREVRFIFSSIFS